MENSADHQQDWKPYPVDPYLAICDDHTHTHIYIYMEMRGHKNSSGNKWKTAIPKQEFVFGSITLRGRLLHERTWRYSLLDLREYVTLMLATRVSPSHALGRRRRADSFSTYY